MIKMLADLVVWEELRVHKLMVKPRQVKATYSIVTKEGSRKDYDLIYSYKEKVFNPLSAQDQNIASIMVAQVAMNYGLFCERLVFEGNFDSQDRQLIRDMTENTCREIYVNKFLKPTEFLIPPFNTLTFEKKSKYTHADIVFESEEKRSSVHPKTWPEPDYRKLAILSSGGKDSLLSYGILNELFEAHPVFVNESGRHWYTAYNAYHYLSATEPQTSKVWCNADRVFNWLTALLPFIRKDFQRIRSDQYPIRLWTVSVFLWGVLPIAIKRGIGNIVVGNEYDTTVRTRFEGLVHYAGLYDQSKYFDNMYSRYYRSKGWNIRQFSILRPLSELMILKILVKRYPDLQARQVSCHAAHKEDQLMKPCGKCEKCRRIIGMLIALDDDPRRCGYDEDQIRFGLKALETKSVKQLGSDAGHLYFLLGTKGVLDPDSDLIRKAQCHPEIMGMRFDNERSNPEDMPLEIRKPVLEIFEKYSEGSYIFEERRWLKMDNGQTEALLNKSYFLTENKNV